LGATILSSLLFLLWRPPTPAKAAVALAIATLSVVIGYREELSNSIAVYQAQAALKGISDPTQIEQALQRNPSNSMLQLMAVVSKVGQESKAAAQKLFDAIEPPRLAQDPNFASRADLESYRRDLKTAEVNASSAMPRYVALLRAEREKVQSFVNSLDDRSLQSAMAGVDNRHAKSTSFSSKMMLARAEFYRAYGDCIEILIEQFGAFKIGKSGEFVFSDNAIVERYNIAANAMTAASKRVADLEDEGKKLTQAQQEGFDRFISRQ
jgi:hypothetical protein